MQQTIQNLRRRNFIMQLTCGRPTRLRARSPMGANRRAAEKGSRSGSQAPTGLYATGNSLCSPEDNPRVAAEFEQAIKLDPRLAVAHYRLGQTLNRMGQKK